MPASFTSPDLVCRQVDFDPDASVAQAADALVRELLNPDDEDEVVLRGCGRYVPRLVRGMPEAVAAPGDHRFHLVFDHRAGQDGVRLQRAAVGHPGPGEIAVRVKAAGVNFRDVLRRIGLLPEEAFEGGFAGASFVLEFAGEVIEVGHGVDHLQPGDAVLGFGRGTFASHLVTPAFCVFCKPPTMSFEEAATLPVAMVTVHYALHHLARLQPGERILIHGAAGGVGLAAIQFAQSVGAEIFGSAGSADKVDFLHRLGVPHIVDSRSLAFADEILEATGGEGIDVVLNSVAGEAVHKGLSILRPFGRFVELGKRDFYANSKLGLQPFRDNLQFFGVDVDRLLVDRPALARQIFAELTPRLADGCFTPLPHRVFPISRAAEAFRCMQQSRHIGKIILTMDPPARLAPSSSPPSVEFKLAEDASFLVTGGRNGFGLETAAWLARKGVRHLALVGRSFTTPPMAAAIIAKLRRDGVAVHEFSADVADDHQLAEVLQRIRRDLPPLRGVFHCAGVIRDASFANLGEAEFFEVLRPKIAGAWNLHRQTREDRLEHFVLYSSATTLIGNPGQANYVAGNIYLEALAAYRRSLGLPGAAVAWGAIGEVGHLARNPGVARMLSDRLGIK